MASRQTSMAAIDAALATPRDVQTEVATGQQPPIAPPGGSPPPTTQKRLHRRRGLSRAIAPPGGSPPPTTDQAEDEREKTEQQKAQQQGAALQTSTRQLLESVQRIWQGTKVTLESLPTPGSIIVPLVVLLVFFFFLVPVNGHTRIVWLWLVLSGNAKIAPGQSSTTTSAPTSPTPVPPQEQIVPGQAGAGLQAINPGFVPFSPIVGHVGDPA